MVLETGSATNTGFSTAALGAAAEHRPRPAAGCCRESAARRAAMPSITSLCYE